MRSRAARLTLAAAICIAVAVGVVSFFLVQSERQLDERRAAVRMIDGRARETVAAIAEVRSAQRAYVAAGQSLATWTETVSALLEEADRTIDALGERAATAPARSLLTKASAAVAELGEVDQRVRDYLQSGERLMAADVLFVESDEVTAAGMQSVEGASRAEREALEELEATVRAQRTYALGGTALLAVVVLVVLSLARPQTVALPDLDMNDVAEGGSLDLREDPSAAKSWSSTTETSGEPPSGIGGDAAFRLAAELCTEMGQASNVAAVKKVLDRAAEALDAKGLIVWLGSAAGADLRPVLSHGYPPEVVAHMASVARSADNAAASAYRSGALQVVLGQSGVSSGAIVAPLLAPEGCVGVLAAEIADGGEASDVAQSLATIFAAQLTAVVAPSEAAPVESLEEKQGETAASA